MNKKNLVLLLIVAATQMSVAHAQQARDRDGEPTNWGAQGGASTTSSSSTQVVDNEHPSASNEQNNNNNASDSSVPTDSTAQAPRNPNGHGFFSLQGVFNHQQGNSNLGGGGIGIGYHSSRGFVHAATDFVAGPTPNNNGVQQGGMFTAHGYGRFIGCRNRVVCGHFGMHGALTGALVVPGPHVPGEINGALTGGIQFHPARRLYVSVGPALGGAASNANHVGVFGVGPNVGVNARARFNNGGALDVNAYGTMLLNFLSNGQVSDLATGLHATYNFSNSPLGIFANLNANIPMSQAAVADAPSGESRSNPTPSVTIRGGLQVNFDGQGARNDDDETD